MCNRVSDFVSMSKNILDIKVDVQQSPDGYDELGPRTRSPR
jgi:hypothetical protein